MGSNNPTLYKNLAEFNSKPSTILSVNAVEWAILRVFSCFCCVEWTATFEQQSNSTGLSPYFNFGCFPNVIFIHKARQSDHIQGLCHADRRWTRSVVIDLRLTP